MQVNEHRGRTFDVASTTVKPGEYRGVFDVDSTSEDVTDGVINEPTCDTYPSREAAEEAAGIAACKWIDADADGP